MISITLVIHSPLLSRPTLTKLQKQTNKKNKIKNNENKKTKTHQHKATTKYFRFALIKNQR